ncbi:MAG: helix-turn-helix domain-containing protein [Thermoplasmata archaeon]|jgi:DNA-binding MarR family transcriptional regulator
MAYGIERLDKKAGTLSVLLLLGVADGVKMTDLCRSIPLERATISRAVALLEEFDLVTLSDSAGFPFTKRVALSSLGRRLVHSPIQEWPSIFFEHEVDGSRALPFVKLPRESKTSSGLTTHGHTTCVSKGKARPQPDSGPTD